MSAVPPPPDGQVVSLVAALSNAQNHDVHVQAISARDEALHASLESYGNICTQMSYLMAAGGSSSSSRMQDNNPALQHFRTSNPEAYQKLVIQQDESTWIQFGQMAGYILKEALIHPPTLRGSNQVLYVMPAAAREIKQSLLYTLSSPHGELRNVASSVIATTSVSTDSVQPHLSVPSWPELIDCLVAPVSQGNNNPALMEGCLTTIRKIMEDGPTELTQLQLDSIIPVLLQLLLVQPSPADIIKISALQSMDALLGAGLMPSSLVAHFGDYLGALSSLATHSSPRVRMLVCRSIVTILSNRTEYLQQHMDSICRFMLQSTSDIAHPDVAMEACEFWLTFANIAVEEQEEACTPMMVDTVATILAELVPTLLRCMVYSPEQQQELLYRNEMDTQQQQNLKPVFHKIKSKRGTGDDDDDDGDDVDDDDGNSWTLRKCAAASLDCLAGFYGPDGILPPLLPALQGGLASTDPWVQEASILALGAISQGCEAAMAAHMAELHPYLMNHLAAGATNSLPQVSAIAAWTIGRYASWAVEQVQSGTQGHLLAQMTEVYLTRLADQNRKCQISCCSAFGVVVEIAGELMIPYLEPIFQGFNRALHVYQGRSLLVLFDVLAILADFVGPAIGEDNLPALYVPTLLKMWDSLARQDPTDHTLVPLLECLASIALGCGINFQPYAMETFDNAMAMIESVTIHLASSGEAIENDEDADPIICAADVIDGLVEGLMENFTALVSSSQRYGPVFTNVLKDGLVRHEVPGVRMSAFAIIGDLARNAPQVLEPALFEILKESISNLDTTHPNVCNNAVWAIGEICLKCQGNPAPLSPVAQPLVQHLIILMMGNGVSAGGVGIPGLPENAATTMGRLALVDATFVSTELPRFLLGWCDGMARITDATERRDAFQGFVSALYANPNAIQTAATRPADAISSILFAIISWHLPNEHFDPKTVSLVQFHLFPQAEAQLGLSLKQLLKDIKGSVGDETWSLVESQMPVNIRKLLREVYEV